MNLGLASATSPTTTCGLRRSSRKRRQGRQQQEQALSGHEAAHVGQPLLDNRSCQTLQNMRCILSHVALGQSAAAQQGRWGGGAREGELQLQV